MRVIDKTKKKLKRKKWINQHRGTVVLILLSILSILNSIFLPINPPIAIAIFAFYGLIGVVGGIETLFRDKKHKRDEDELTKDLDILTGASKETVVEIQKEIEQTKEKPLVKALIRRKKLVEKELKEKEIAYSNGVNSVEIGLD